MEDDEQASTNAELAKIADDEAENSELIFLTYSCIDYIFLWLFEDDFKASDNGALGESVGIEAVIGVYLE